MDWVDGVSKNSGTPKSSILIGFSIINHPFWGPLFLETPVSLWKSPILPSFFVHPATWAPAHGTHDSTRERTRMHQTKWWSTFLCKRKQSKRISWDLDFYQWSFLVPFIGGRYHIITQLAIYKWYISGIKVGVSKNKGTPKWMVVYNGKPYCLMDDLGGKPHYFWKHPLLCTNQSYSKITDRRWMLRLPMSSHDAVKNSHVSMENWHKRVWFCCCFLSPNQKKSKAKLRSLPLSSKGLPRIP